MTNWDLYNFVHVVSNKDVYGNWLTPSRFQTLLQVENIRLLRDRLGLPERYQPGTFQAGGSASRVIEGDVSPFLVISENETVASGKTSLTDWYYINDFYVSGAYVCDIISQQEFSGRVNNPNMPQDAKYPFALIVTEGLKIYPNTITKTYISYYRKPVTPTFVTTTDITTGELTYGTSVELEWNDDGKIDIAYRILQSLGITIERQDLEQYAQKLVETGK